LVLKDIWNQFSIVISFLLSFEGEKLLIKHSRSIRALSEMEVWALLRNGAMKKTSTNIYVMQEKKGNFLCWLYLFIGATLFKIILMGNGSHTLAHPAYT